MKKRNLLLPLLVLAIFLSGCQNDDSSSQPNWSGDACLVNSGIFNGTFGDVSAYNSNTNELINNAYSTINSPITSGGYLQFIYEYGSNIYLFTNTGDKMFWVDKNTFVQSSNGISSLEMPRYCVGDRDYLWIACWGPDPYSTSNPSQTNAGYAYIAKYNTKSREVESKIMLPGGPEGLALVNGKLYAALAFTRKVAVIDVDSELTEFIDMPAVCSYFVSDSDNNLYVSLVSTWNDYSDSTGLAYINTKTNTLDAYYSLANVSTNYSQIMDISFDKSTIYIVSGLLNSDYLLEGSIQKFDTGTKQFSPFVTKLLGVNGLSVDPHGDKVYCYTSQNPVAPGSLIVFDQSGVKLSEQVTGIFPTRMLFK